MMKDLEYPFDCEVLIKKRKKIKHELLDKGDFTKTINIAVLGGETTRDICEFIEIFLMNYGFKVNIYESEYNQYYEDGMFPNPELEEYKPDFIYICTCIRNIPEFPDIQDSKDAVSDKMEVYFSKLKGLWDRVASVYNCPIIQNNFEYPYYRILGNKDAYDHRGKVNFVTSLNCRIYDYAQTHENFFVCDINYLSALYGLEKWSDPYYWHMYKYAVAVPAIPYLSFNVSNIIKSILGKNKKAFNLDLDNTLWGGVIGDDGAENIEIGQETSLAQTYSEFQEYIKQHKQIGILLTVNSKNDEANALAGFQRPDSILKREDFVSFKANWNPKSQNLNETASELNLLPESFVFVDDNPAEREIITTQIPGVAVPELQNIEHFIRIIDRSGYFEMTNLSEDDLSRSRMYQENEKRHQMEMSFVDYKDYLKSLEMKGEIQSFSPMYMSRIAQLTNKSNQFNLTTKRYTQTEIEQTAEDPDRLTLYGRLEDKFGDNGVVSIVIGRIDGPDKDELHMELWLMSCRVLKRDMEFAMMDEVVRRAQARGIKRIIGYYYPTAKNAMVKDFYAVQGFIKISEDDCGNTVWQYDVPEKYTNRQDVIRVNPVVS